MSKVSKIKYQADDQLVSGWRETLRLCRMTDGNLITHQESHHSSDVIHRPPINQRPNFALTVFVFRSDIQDQKLEMSWSLIGGG